MAHHGRSRWTSQFLYLTYDESVHGMIVRQVNSPSDELDEAIRLPDGPT